MKFFRPPFPSSPHLADRVARTRYIAYGIATFMAFGSMLVAPSARNGALITVLLAAALIPLVRVANSHDHLKLAFKVDALAILGLWWLEGPVAGLGVGLFLVAALAGVLLSKEDAARVGVAVLVSEAAQIPLHALSERYSDLPLLHPVGQVVAMSDFLAASSIRLVALAATIGVFRSIGTSIRSYQQEISRSEESFRGAFEGAPMGVALVDCSGAILRANERLTAVLPPLANAENMIVLEDGRSDSVCELLRSVLDDEMPAGQVNVEPVPGRFTRVWISAVRDADAALVHAVVHAEDVTEEVKSTERLEQLVRSKDEFVAAISHELRTPLTAVVGFSSVLRDSVAELDAEIIQEMVSDIARESSEVASIVDDLLVIARADIGKVTLLPKSIEVGEQVAQVTQHLTLLGKHLEADTTEASIHVDPMRFRQILRNLLSNAVRYGGTNIRITNRFVDGEHQVTVSDDGLGVDELDVDRIFDPYERANDRPSQPASVGLGLAVARSLSQAMGGDLTYERSMGWTNFTLNMPARAEGPGLSAAS